MLLVATPERVSHGAQGRSRSGFTLAAAVLGFFVVTLDAVVVNVALPSIQADLGGGITGLQWVVDGYTLMFAALLLTAGALSDRIGARRAFAAGLSVFAVASAACGLAPSLGALVIARFVQGAAAAVLMPSCLASSWPSSMAPPMSSPSAARRGWPGSRSSPGGWGADSVIEGVGTQESMLQAIGATRPGGHVGFVGVAHGVELSVEGLFWSLVHLHGGPAPVRRFLPELIELIWTRRIDPGKVFDLDLPLEQAAEGYRAMDQRRAIKTLLRP